MGNTLLRPGDLLMTLKHASMWLSLSSREWIVVRKDVIMTLIARVPTNDAWWLPRVNKQGFHTPRTWREEMLYVLLPTNKCGWIERESVQLVR
jgi:hypothetical protein